jgi:hypothetical protein
VWFGFGGVEVVMGLRCYDNDEEDVVYRRDMASACNFAVI